jgi:hypothetical protein
MKNGGELVVTSTKLAPAERALVDAAARLEGCTVSAVVRRLLIPAARERVAELATGPADR